MSGIQCRVCGKVDFTEYLLILDCMICKRCASKIHEEFMRHIVESNRRGEIP